MHALVLPFTPEELATLREAAARAGMGLEAWADLALARASAAPAVWSALEIAGERRVEWHADGSATVRWPSGKVERWTEEGT